MPALVEREFRRYQVHGATVVAASGFLGDDARDRVRRVLQLDVIDFDAVALVDFRADP